MITDQQRYKIASYGELLPVDGGKDCVSKRSENVTPI